MALQEIDETNFEAEVLKSDLPVVVDFWAPWCGPCKALAPLLDSLAAQYAGKIKVVKLNVEAGENAGIAARYLVRGLPTLMVLRGGEPGGSLGTAISDKVKAWFAGI